MNHENEVSRLCLAAGQGRFPSKAGHRPFGDSQDREDGRDAMWSSSPPHATARNCRIARRSRVILLLACLVITGCSDGSISEGKELASLFEPTEADVSGQLCFLGYLLFALLDLEPLKGTSSQEKIKRLMEAQGLQRHVPTGQTYYTSYTDIYDWEMYFDGLALAYYGGESHTIGGLRVFLGSQREDGFISRRVLKQEPPANQSEDGRRIFGYESNELCKPFLCQAALIVARMRGDVSWLDREEFGRLKRFVNHWLTVWDRDGNGLSEWASAPHSGADTQLERIGPWESYFCEGVDLNCYLHRELLAIAELAQALGLAEDSAYFGQQAEKKRDRIQSLLWDEQDSFYYSRDRRTGERIKVKSAETFLPLWAGVATPEQARLLVSCHLKNPAEFWTPYPVPSYARSEPHYTQHFRPKLGIPECEFV